MAKKPEKKKAPETADEVIKAARFNADGLIGEVGDFYLAQFKAAGQMKPWEKMSEEDQREKIEQAKHSAKTLVAGVVQAIASRGLPYIAAKLGGGSFKVGEGTVEVKASMMFTPENAERLAGGSVDVMLVFADANEFDGELTAAPEPDQRSLDVDQAREEGEEVDESTGEIKPKRGRAAAANDESASA